MAKEATLYELIFGEAPVILTSRRMMWSKLGKGELDEETVEKMLAEGYEAMVGDDESDEDDKDKKVLLWQDQEERAFCTDEF